VVLLLMLVLVDPVALLVDLVDPVDPVDLPLMLALVALLAAALLVEVVVLLAVGLVVLLAVDLVLEKWQVYVRLSAVILSFCYSEVFLSCTATRDLFRSPLDIRCKRIVLNFAVVNVARLT